MESTSGPTVAPVRNSFAVVAGFGKKSMVARRRAGRNGEMNKND